MKTPDKVDRIHKLWFKKGWGKPLLSELMVEFEDGVIVDFTALLSKATQAARRDELRKLPIEYFCRMDEGRIKDRLKALNSEDIPEGVMQVDDFSLFGEDTKDGKV